MVQVIWVSSICRENNSFNAHVLGIYVIDKCNQLSYYMSLTLMRDQHFPKHWNIDCYTKHGCAILASNIDIQGLLTSVTENRIFLYQGKGNKIAAICKTINIAIAVLYHWWLYANKIQQESWKWLIFTWSANFALRF